MWWITGALVIVLLSLSPVIPILTLGLLGLADNLNESNSSIAALPWMLFVTLPAGALSMVVWIVIGIVAFVSGGK